MKGKGLFISLLVVLLCLGGLTYGAYKFLNPESEETKLNSKADKSYKVKTKRNKRYNGVYTLTKLDTKGKNTWNGLLMYVKDDKIISAEYLTYQSFSSIEKENPNVKKWNYSLYADKTSLISNVTFDNFLQTGFGFPPNSVQLSANKKGIIASNGQILFYKKKVDFNKDYENLYRCKVSAGYDEKSKEIWLSKLLNNKKSEYYKGYKLIHYKDYFDMNKKCVLNDGSCIQSLNSKFHAGLNNNDK